MKIEIQSTEECNYVEFSGKLGGMVDLDVRNQIDEVIQSGNALSVDLSKVTGFSGTGIRRLLLLFRRIQVAGVPLKVIGGSLELLGFIDAVGFLDLFEQPPAIAAPPARSETARIDVYPTHQYQGFSLRPGRPLPLGATPITRGINFAVVSQHATSCALVLFRPGEQEPFVEIPFPDGYRVGDIFTMIVFDLEPDNIEYGFRVDGPFNPAHGQRFDPTKVLIDPMARCVVGRDRWGDRARNPERGSGYRGRIVPEDFDWEGDRPLEIPMEELVIYEMHVRGFTRNPSAKVRFPGTFMGLRQKIGYLKELGVNCVELMPVFEFDELENVRRNAITGERLVNYWGYSTVGFFAPKAGYAATGRAGLQSDEFKALVKELHRNGIEVILDVVFNHTAEGDERGPTISFRGFDNRAYYMLTESGSYYNFSGCGNTFNCNHPLVRNFVLNCLQYWVSEYHIDGFRFDLASILGRDRSGTPLSNPPLLEALAMDPVLSKTKLIAEAWDAGGLYQVGTFPSYGRWAEWNGKYRDCARRFLKGDAGQVLELADRVTGSPDLYPERGPAASINFITCHDGFTLQDLVSYDEKHNAANGEQNRDGTNDNESWNCGFEGPTDDPQITRLRERQVKNALAILMLSEGVPMLSMGDECGRTKHGNNNTYCHDGPLNWFDWDLPEKYAERLRFCRLLIDFRRRRRVLHLPHERLKSPRTRERLLVDWHGTQPHRPDWSAGSRVLAYSLRGHDSNDNTEVYVAMNMWWESLDFLLPRPSAGLWRLAINTAAAAPDDIAEPDAAPALADQEFLRIEGRSIVVLVATPPV